MGLCSRVPPFDTIVRRVLPVPCPLAMYPPERMAASPVHSHTKLFTAVVPQLSLTYVMS